jgi:hypothetical protein
MASPDNALPSIIGAAVPRIDGPLKVSGNAMYTADFHFPGMVYAIPVCSTVAKGKYILAVVINDIIFKWRASFIEISAKGQISR